MARLTMDQISRENQDRDAGSVASLKLSHRALSDVSLLSGFKNLERLDLSSNCLSTLEALSSCVNLKWLSVVENKLKSLKGIEGLSNLTVLNAGKNKLERIDEVTSATALRALILNDNNLSSICKLDKLQFLNTLVLSRNPILDIGDSLKNAKSITKLSLSHCQIEAIGSTLVACVDLRELRLAHNKITALPAELGQNSKLRNLDLGNNLIENWSDLKVLSALHRLKSLNLLGNLVNEKDKLANKIRKLLPKLRILNAKPIERADVSKKLFPISSQSKDDLLLHNSSDIGANKERKRTILERDLKLSKQNVFEVSTDDEAAAHPISTNGEQDEVMKRKGPKPSIKDPKKNISKDEDNQDTGNKLKRKIDDENNVNREVKEEPKQKKGKQVTTKDPKKDRSHSSAIDMQATKLRKEPACVEDKKSEGIDDAETPFFELILPDRNQSLEKKMKEHNTIPDTNLPRALVMDHTKKKKNKAKSTSSGHLALQLLPPVSDVGMGGPSTWND